MYIETTRTGKKYRYVCQNSRNPGFSVSSVVFQGLKYGRLCNWFESLSISPARCLTLSIVQALWHSIGGVWGLSCTIALEGRARASASLELKGFGGLAKCLSSLMAPRACDPNLTGKLVSQSYLDVYFDIPLLRMLFLSRSTVLHMPLVLIKVRRIHLL